VLERRLVCEDGVVGTRDQGPWTRDKDQRPRTKDQGPRIRDKDQDPRTTDRVRGLGTLQMRAGSREGSLLSGVWKGARWFRGMGTGVWVGAKVCKAMDLSFPRLFSPKALGYAGVGVRIRSDVKHSRTHGSRIECGLRCRRAAPT